MRTTPSVTAKERPIKATSEHHDIIEIQESMIPNSTSRSQREQSNSHPNR